MKHDNEAEKRKTDPGRPHAPSAEQIKHLDVLRQRLKDGEIDFAEFTVLAHHILGKPLPKEK